MAIPILLFDSFLHSMRNVLTLFLTTRRTVWDRSFTLRPEEIKKQKQTENMSKEKMYSSKYVWEIFLAKNNKNEIRNSATLAN